MSKVKKIVIAAAVFGVVGLAALPVASYAVADTKPVTVSVSVTDGLSLACAGDYSHSYGVASNATDSTGTASETSPGSCTVITNHAGYTLTLADADTSTDLVDGAKTIPTNAGHIAGTPGWSVKIGDNSGLSGGRLAMPASGGTPISVANTSAASAIAGDVYKYGFATSIAATTASGSYTDTVTFTATGK